MSQLCNVVYADLAEGRNKVQMAELEKALAPPEDRDRHEAAASREAHAALGIGLIAPPPKAKK